VSSPDNITGNLGTSASKTEIEIGDSPYYTPVRQAPKMKASVGSVLALLWICITALFFLGLSVAVFADPHFPLAIGVFRTVGRTGLWVTLLPTLAAMLGLILWRRQKFGSALVSAYSLFWFIAFLSCLPYVWNAKRSFCLRNFCITTPWLGRLTVLALAAPFLLASIWAGCARFQHQKSANVH
jgi:hypothetical protein